MSSTLRSFGLSWLQQQKRKLPGKFIFQMSVLLEMIKTYETARVFQPKPEQGEGSRKGKRLFLVALLCFASEFG